MEDPTLLLTIEDYKQLCEGIAYKNYIFIYSVNMGSAEDVYWESLKNMFPNRSFVVTPASGSIAGGELFGNEVVYDYATPERWLSLINKSELVITSSFHGIVFSILFNKRFAFVPIKGAYAATNNRINDLLKGVGLSEFVINTPQDYITILNKEIDWDTINRNKKNLIRSSIDFLNNSL